MKTFEFAARSERGPVRLTNQDAIFASPSTLAIADGVGGGPAGDLASKLVVTQFADSARPVTARVEAANMALSTVIGQQPELAGMATTLSALQIDGDEILIVHVGDSRVYQIADGRLELVTRDDSWVQFLVDEGALEPAEAQTHPMRNLILHSLSGAPTDSETVWVSHRPLVLGERWLVTTDGLSDYLSEELLALTLSEHLRPQEAADALVELALSFGSRDNVSVIVADVVENTNPHRSVFLGSAAPSSELEAH